MKRTIRNAYWRPNWTSFIAALESAFIVMKETAFDTANLMGLTGFAFRITVHDQLCPSGPTMFDWPSTFAFAMDQVGYDADFVYASKDDNLFEYKRNLVIKQVADWINRRVPVIVWHLDIPEFGLIIGYDKPAKEFTLCTCMDVFDGQKKIPFSRLASGEGEAGILAVLFLKKKVRIDVKRSIEKSILFAVSHFHDTSAICPSYANGEHAYKNWIKALKSDSFDPFGLAYTAQVVTEARKFAYMYLNDIPNIFPAKKKTLYKKAAGLYKKVFNNLKPMSERFAFSFEPQQEVKKEDLKLAIECLKGAASYEKDAIAVLSKCI